MAAMVEELKEIIVNLIMQLARSCVPNGCCVNAYFYVDYVPECGDKTCEECKKDFFKIHESKIREQINKL